MSGFNPDAINKGRRTPAWYAGIMDAIERRIASGTIDKIGRTPAYYAGQLPRIWRLWRADVGYYPTQTTKKGGDAIAANQDNAGADVGNRKVTYRSKKSLLR